MKKYLNNQNGFTLLEITTAVGIFMIVILAVTSISIMVLNTQKLSIASQNVQESMRYALEYISKDARTAIANPQNGSCGAGLNKIFNQSNPADPSDLYFVNQNNECTRYFLSENSLMIEKDSTIASVTPVSISVKSIKFIITDSSDGTTQPKVTMNMDAEYVSGKEQFRQPIILQTTITCRTYVY